jgi:molecular chaperone DnaK
MVYMTEKSLKEHADKVDPATKSTIEAAVEKTKKAMESDDVQTINTAVEELQQASHKLAEAMYQQASAGAGGAAGGPDAQQQAGTGGASGPPEDDVVDADFTEVKEDKK